METDKIKQLEMIFSNENETESESVEEGVIVIDKKIITESGKMLLKG